MDFEKIFNESRVDMSRHISNEEKNAVVEEIKAAIRKGNATLLPKPKNRQFLSKAHLSESEVFRLIETYLKPQCIIGVMPNRNFPKSGSPELYLMKMYIKKFSAYIKVDLFKNKAVFWSIHELTSTLDRDFQHASDYQEDNLLKVFAWEWSQAYNAQCDKSLKIVNRFIRGKTLHFDFACGTVDYNVAEKIVPILMKTKPHRLYDISVQQSDIRAGGIEFELLEK